MPKKYLQVGHAVYASLTSNERCTSCLINQVYLINLLQMQYLHMYCSFRMFKQDEIMNYILENGLTKRSSRSGFFPP